MTYSQQRNQDQRRRHHGSGNNNNLFINFVSPNLPYFLCVVTMILLLLPASVSSSTTSYPPSTTTVAVTRQSNEEQRLIEEFLSHRYDIQLPSIGDGQAALVDKQSRRVYWQSGGPTLHPHDVFGKTSFLSQWSHCKAIVLSTLLWTCLLTVAITRRLWDYLLLLTKATIPSQQPPTPLFTTTTSTNTIQIIIYWIRQLLRKLLSIGISIILILTKPRFKLLTCNPYVIGIIYLLYLSESYTSSTRRYLANTMSQHHVEHLMETLRNTKPIVTWSLRCYHYNELPPSTLLPSSLKEEDEVNKKNRTAPSTAATSAIKALGNFVHQRKPTTTTRRRRKVVTHQATKQFEFTSWTDHSIVGLWKRAPISLLPPASTKVPFTKLSFSKMLVLADEKIREEYFSQQAKFISLEGRKDEHAEYSTTIEVMGLKSNNTNKVLVVRDVDDRYQWFHNLFMFWLVTLLGFTVPFRIWFSRHCDDVRVTLIKEISSNVTTTRATSISMGRPLWGSLLSRPKGNGSESTEQLELRREQFRQAMRTLELYPCNLHTTTTMYHIPNETNQTSAVVDLLVSDEKLNGDYNETADTHQTAVQKYILADDTDSMSNVNSTQTATNATLDEQDNIDIVVDDNGIVVEEQTLKEISSNDGSRT